MFTLPRPGTIIDIEQGKLFYFDKNFAQHNSAEFTELVTILPYFYFYIDVNTFRSEPQNTKIKCWGKFFG